MVTADRQTASGTASPSHTLSDLLPTETLLAEARDSGAWVHCAATDTLVRADFLVELLCGRGRFDGRAARMVRLVGATVLGPLDLEAFQMCAPLILDSCALDDVNLEQTTARGVAITNGRVRSLSGIQLTSLFLDLKGTHFEYGVRLAGAEIAGNLILEGSRLRPRGGTALDAPNLTVGGNLSAPRLDALGEVQLAGARVAGSLNFRDARLRSPSGLALQGQSLRVEQDLQCSGDFLAVGEVRLLGAVVDGQLDLRGATILGAGSGRRALTADLVTVGQDLVGGPAGRGNQPLTVLGQLRLPGAHVNGRVNLDGALVANSGDKSLFAEGMHVDEDVRFGRGFISSGNASLAGARIGQTLNFERADLRGFLDLRSARVRHLADTGATRIALLAIRGLDYQSLSDMDDEKLVGRRIAWLANDVEGYSPQIYNQLARAYRIAGRDEAARDVLVAKLRARSRARREAEPRRLARWGEALVDRLEDWTVGYGYRPMRGFAWLAGLVAIGSLLFSRLFAGRDVGEAFHPVLYTLDLLLPVAGLKQVESVEGVAVSPTFVWWNAGFTVLGWLLGIVLLAGLSGLFKKD